MLCLALLFVDIVHNHSNQCVICAVVYINLCVTGVENVSDHRTIGPRKFFGVARKYFKFQKQKRVYWPDINVNFS